MIEIERRFLVAESPPELPRPVVIEQAYLATGVASVRVRRAGDRYLLTIKAGQGMVRHEIERELDEEEFVVLWGLGTELRIAKRRFLIALDHGLVAEYDEFEGDLSGRRLVEVEFGDVEIAQAFDPPSWFGTEVTDDPRFTNRALAQHGWPD